MGLGVVGLLAGLMFSTSAGLADDQSERQPENFRDLVRVESERLAETNADVVALREEVAALLEEQNDPAEADELLAHASGTTAVTGPGLLVRLDDAPTPVQLPEWASPDDLVVHQQDLEAVMNGLWAGGAEALMVQGHRVTMTTSVRCVGNVLLIDGATYSPPYEIAAIGDPDELEETLLSTAPIQIYLQYVDALNLGWQVRAEETIEMPADESNLSMEYASVPG
ncbi:DUF881 domain-containing protein [Pseudactinotalea suaedae]